MPQENNEVSWYERFSKARHPIFSDKSVRKYVKWAKKELKYFKELIPENGKILDTGCGLGIMSVSLSILGYDVTGIDNDSRVVEAAKENTKNFGKNAKIIKEDIFNINKRFRENSFNACISGGVLEHFPKEEIIEILNKQLKLAPVVVATMPILTDENLDEMYKDYEKRICNDGIYRNLWTEKEWLEILKDFNIVKHRVFEKNPTFGKFKEMMIVIKNK